MDKEEDDAEEKIGSVHLEWDEEIIEEEFSRTKPLLSVRFSIIVSIS